MLYYFMFNIFYIVSYQLVMYLYIRKLYLLLWFGFGLC